MIGRGAAPLCRVDAFAQALDQHVFCGMRFRARRDGGVGGTNARRLVDADLLVDGEMQREMQEGIHRAGLGRPFLGEGRLGIRQQVVVFRVTGDDIHRRDFGADERQAFLMLFPGVAEKAANLITRWVEHPASFP